MEEEDYLDGVVPVELEAMDCPLCLEAISDRNRQMLPCYHGFHDSCITRWLKIFEACPLCKVPRLRSEKSNNLQCPLKGCSERLAKRKVNKHMASRHKLQKCKKCNDMFLSHLRAKHVRSGCSNRLISCPASGCKEKIPLYMAAPAIEDPDILLKNHGCTELYNCSACACVFVDVDHLDAHCSECESVNGNIPSRKRKRRASALECEVNFEWTRRLKTSGFLKGVDPSSLGPRALRAAIDEFKDHLRREEEAKNIGDGSWAADI